MKLRDMIARRRLISLVCGECHATAELDPAPFVGRRGDNTTLDQIKGDLACPQCGAFDIRLSSVRLPPLARVSSSGKLKSRPELPAWLAPPPPAPMPPQEYWRRAARATRLPPVPPH